MTEPITTPAVSVGADAAALLEKPPRSRRSLPGVSLIRSTSGVQRGMLIAGLVLVGLFLLLAVFADVIAPYGFAEQTNDAGKTFTQLQDPSGSHLFGTSSVPFDVFSRTVYGARTAVIVIVLSLAFSLTVGVPLGLISGYFGGILDRILVVIMDALFGFPSLLLAIVVNAALSRHLAAGFGGIVAAAISITVVFVPQYYRLVRNATLTVKTEPFVDAARVTGAGPIRIMGKHIFANVTNSLPVIVTLNGSEAILTLAGLGFLGVGVEPTAAAEWGYDLQRSISDVTNGVWWTAIFPGGAIVLAVLGLTLVGESLNEASNPLLRTRSRKQKRNKNKEVNA